MTVPPPVPIQALIDAANRPVTIATAAWKLSARRTT